jgi:hypothetical protein
MKALEILIDDLRKEKCIEQIVLNFKVSSGFIGVIPEWDMLLSNFQTQPECETEIKKWATKQISTSVINFVEIDENNDRKLKARLKSCKKEQREALNQFIKALNEYRYTSDLRRVILKREMLNNELARELFDLLKSYLGQQHGRVEIKNNEYVLIQKDENEKIMPPLDKNTALLFQVKNLEQIRTAIAGLIYASKKYFYAVEHYKSLVLRGNSNEKKFMSSITQAMYELADIVEFPVDGIMFRDMIRQRYSFPHEVMENFNVKFRTARQAFNRTNKENGTNREILSAKSK